MEITNKFLIMVVITWFKIDFIVWKLNVGTDINNEWVCLKQTLQYGNGAEIVEVEKQYYGLKQTLQYGNSNNSPIVF